MQAMLERTYDVSGDDLAGQLTEVAGKLAEEYWTEHQQDFFYIVDGSFLEEYDEYNIGVPVSYTHLDVYKRQAQLSAMLSGGTVPGSLHCGQ